MIMIETGMEQKQAIRCRVHIASSRNTIHVLQIWMCSLLFINMIIIYYPIPALFLFVYLFSFVLNESEILMAIYHK